MLNADRNTAVLIAFCAVSFALFGWLLSESLHGNVEVTETTVGAIVGGFLAGFFGLAAAAYATYQDRLLRMQQEEKTDEVMLHSVLTKLIDLEDVVRKNRRHFMTDDIKSRVYFDAGGQHRYFSKPLEGEKEQIVFSVTERTFFLRKYGGDWFSELSDMNGIAKSYSFLHRRHTEAYYRLNEEIFGDSGARKEYVWTAEVDLNSPRLAAMMDIDGAFRSLLNRSAPEVHNFLSRVVEVANRDTSVNIRYAVNDLPPAAENEERLHY